MSKREINIKVAVRVRPIMKDKPDKIAITWDGGEIKAKDKVCRFDHVFGPESSQLDVYLATLNPMIQELLNGYNCTVLTYGQAGSGKTYTISGDINKNKMPTTDIQHWTDNNAAGIIPRAVLQIFDVLSSIETNYTVKVSYLELYNEEIRDLLSDTRVFENLMVYADPHIKGSVYIRGLKEVTVYCKNDVIAQWETGLKRRQTALTPTNVWSSRSHAVFIITVVMRHKLPNGTDIIRTAKLNIVDLAGRENIVKAGVKDMRAVELANINKSLLTLGRVITLLVENASHIPYRDSKLTRILQDSLGGNCFTCMIANVSPTSSCLEETITTLEYALRASEITNCPEANSQTTRDEMPNMFNEEMARLQREIEVLQGNTTEEFFIDRHNDQEMQKTIESCNPDKSIDKHKRISELQQKYQELKEVHSLKVEEWKLMQVELDKHKSLLEKYKAKNKEQKAVIKQGLEHYVRQVLEERDQQMSEIACDLMDSTKTLSENEEQLHGKVNQLYSKSKQYAQVTRESMNDITGHIWNIDDVSKSICENAESAIVVEVQKQTIDEHLINFFIASEQLLSGVAISAFHSAQQQYEDRNKRTNIKQLNSLSNKLINVRSDLNDRIKEDKNQLALMPQMIVCDIEILVKQLQRHETSQMKLNDVYEIAKTVSQLHCHMIQQAKYVSKKNLKEIISNLHSSTGSLIASIDKIIKENNDNVKHLKEIQDSDYESLKAGASEKFTSISRQQSTDKNQLVFLEKLRSKINKIQDAIAAIDNVVKNFETVVKLVCRSGDTPSKLNVQVPENIQKSPTEILRFPM